MSAFMLSTLVALAMWGGGHPPACGYPHVTFVQDLESNAGVAYLDGSCRIQLELPYWRRLTFQYKCHLVVHEYGHLYGHEHAASGVMRAGSDHWDVPPECRRAERVRRLVRGLG